MNWKCVIVGVFGVTATLVGMFVLWAEGTWMVGVRGAVFPIGVSITVIGVALFIGALPWKRILNL